MSQEGVVPKLSVVVVSFNGPALLDCCLSALEGQAVRHQAELLVVRRREDDREGYEALEGRFRHVRWVSAPVGSNVPQMRRQGMVCSRGEIIALLEDDCVATDTWCGELLKAHRGGEAAVGGAIEASQYAKRLDWALYFCEYGRFMRPLRQGDAEALPGTNVSYKRTEIRQLLGDNGSHNDDVAADGFYEVLAHQTLRRAGRALKADPDLVVHNVNSWTYSASLKSRFHHGRGFAGMRVTGLPRWRQLAFLGLAVFLPIIQVGRIVTQMITKRRHAWSLGLALPWIVLLSMSWSLGEFVGYLLGPGKSLRLWR